jgi:hypothetical protein
MFESLVKNTYSPLSPLHLCNLQSLQRRARIYIQAKFNYFIRLQNMQLNCLIKDNV